MKNENKCCVYFHINPLKNEIFYVGIGNKKRPYDKRSRSIFWKRIFNKYGYIVNIIESDLNWDDACKKEIFYIKKLGRRDLGTGSLVNMTDGGEGKKGSIISEESRKRISDGHLGQIAWNKGIPMPIPAWNIGYRKSLNLKLISIEKLRVKVESGLIIPTQYMKRVLGINKSNNKPIVYENIQYNSIRELYNEKFKTTMSYEKLRYLIKNKKLN